MGEERRSSVPKLGLTISYSGWPPLNSMRLLRILLRKIQFILSKKVLCQCQSQGIYMTRSGRGETHYRQDKSGKQQKA